MRIQFSPLFLAIACFLTLCAKTSDAQTNIQLFGAVDGGQSLSSSSYSTPYAFNSTTLNLTCSTSPFVATLSGPLMNSSGTAPQLNSLNALQAGGNLLVDNNIFVSVTPQGGAAGTPVNVCPATDYQNSGEGQYTNNCFNSTYQGSAQSFYGQDPDTYELGTNGPTLDYAGGVPPIDISPQLLTTGQPQNVTIALTDEGGDAIGSTIFLTTNCMQGPVTGPAQVSGNPITAGSTPQGLTQTFSFNTATGQQVGLVYDLGKANAADTLTENTSGASPVGGDFPVDPTSFQSAFVPQTSFATSQCLIHTGEALPNGNPACKLYTLECNLDGNPLAGANCPVSTLANEVIEDIFDGPPFTLPNIYTGAGQALHEGIGLLMASEDWSVSNGGNCTFDPSLAELPCPQNLLDSFTGPGGFGGSGQTAHPNSTFISVFGVPEDLTSVFVAGELPDHWVNTRTPNVYFATVAPNFTKGAYVQSGKNLVPLPGAASYIPAPIQSITYGISSAGNVPLPINEPIAGDTVLASGADCSGGYFTSPTEPNFVPAVQKLPSMPDGQYLLHYYSQDCAGTQELQFTQAPNTGSWSTNFYTYPIDIDTTPPVVNGLALTTAAPYKVGSTVYATYSCTDAASGSGVVLCGVNIYAPQTTYNTGTLKTKVYTGSTGSQSFTVVAIDGAGNIVSQKITYTVTH